METYNFIKTCNKALLQSELEKSNIFRIVMRTIYVGFSQPRCPKIGSELIKLWTRSPYSHTYIRFISERMDMSNVYHAAHGMVHFRSYDNFLRDNIAMAEYKIELTDEEYLKLLKQCMELAGEGYGYLELLGIVIVDVANNINIPLKIHDGRGYICSELVGMLCTEILKMKFKKPTYLLCPADVQKALAERFS